MRPEMFLVGLLSSALMTFAAQAQVKHGAAVGAMQGLGNALSDMASRQIDLDNEVELARRTAEIDLDLRRKNLELQRQPQPQQQRVPAEFVARQMAVLDRDFPGWARILSSTAFTTWIDARSESYRAVCRGTQLAAVMTSCLNDFLGARVVTQGP